MTTAVLDRSRAVHHHGAAAADDEHDAATSSDDDDDQDNYPIILPLNILPEFLFASCAFTFRSPNFKCHILAPLGKRCSYGLNFSGPAVAVDTGDSSGLIACDAAVGL